MKKTWRRKRWRMRGGEEEEEEAQWLETVVIAAASADEGRDDNLLSLVEKLYHDAFANNSISTMTPK